VGANFTQKKFPYILYLEYCALDITLYLVITWVRFSYIKDNICKENFPKYYPAFALTYLTHYLL